ncbi:uncharacterized protein [Arachis hypogaea]|uniref:uncharacterized protein isoform X1 n=1 Tax=Arachis hypogaea TaxID=3818 RepID=UPI000DECA058|nr:uncharacterized protein LOC112703540 [Arachis hypogaea]
MLPEAVAIVMAPRDSSRAFFMLEMTPYLNLLVYMAGHLSGELLFIQAKYRTLVLKQFLHACSDIRFHMLSNYYSFIRITIGDKQIGPIQSHTRLSCIYLYVAMVLLFGVMATEIKRKAPHCNRNS